MAKTTKKKVAKKELESAGHAHEIPIGVRKILENVRPTPMVHNGLNNEQKIERITKKFTEIMETLGLIWTMTVFAKHPIVWRRCTLTKCLAVLILKNSRR